MTRLKLIAAAMVVGMAGSAMAQDFSDEPVFPLLKPAPAHPDMQVASVLQHMSGPAADPFEALGNAFDVQEDERPWSTTTSIRLQAKQGDGVGQWVPFMSVARELTAVEDRERLGVGGGLAYYFAPNASFASELLYFGDGTADSNSMWERETRFSLTLRIDF